jgi:hypothetical protein
MQYWLDLFTGTTWDEFQKSGANVSGFSNRMRKNVAKMEPGDVMLCYLTGVLRWVGALEILGKSTETKRIWKDQEFPQRVEVKPLVMLSAENGVPMSDLEGKVGFFKDHHDRGKFKGFVRMSPNLFRDQDDGALIMNMLREAKRAPITRPVDAKKLARKPFFKAERRKGKETISTVVTVPESDIADDVQQVVTTTTAEERVSSTRHTEMQYHLVALATEMGITSWVARNDKSKIWNGAILGEMSGVIQELPTQFNEATNRTIELIDVLWLKGNSIVAAFEVESTTSIYSGLLRMSDLLALQPNLDIDLFLVAPKERREKVKQEILRPTFSLREKPLATVCGFLSFEKLVEKVDGIRRLGLASSLKPDFMKKTAEFFNTEGF